MDIQAVKSKWNIPSAEFIWDWANDRARSEKSLDVFWHAINKLRDSIEEREQDFMDLAQAMSYRRREVQNLNQKLREAKGWGFVYLMKGDGYYKIGYSNRPPKRRMDLSTKLPFELTLICSIETSKARQLENQLHMRFSSKHIRGEWFQLNDTDVEEIKQMGENQ